MQSRILTSLALVLLTASVAHAQSAEAVKSSTSTGDAYAAYSVYYYDANYVGHGMAGRIVDNGSTVTPYPDMAGGTSYQISPLNGDPTVQGFTESSGGLGIAVTNYVKDTAEPVYIYDATDTSSTGSTPIATVSSGWSNVTNLYSLVKVGSYLYAIDYDNARVVEINPSTYAQTGFSYTLPSKTVSGTTYTAHGQALLNINGTLYGLFTFYYTDPSTYVNTYLNSELVKFAITADSSISVSSSNSNLAQNAYAMAVNGSYIYVASIGGYQYSGSYNTAARIQKIPYARLSSVSNVMSPSSTYPYNFLDISFNTTTSPATAYILMGAYNSSYAMNGVLLSTTDFSTFTTIDTISAASGYYWAAQYSSVNNRIWYARGNPIWVYDASSTSTPVAQLTFTSGSLLSPSEPYTYNNLSNFSFVGGSGTTTALRGYRAPIQASSTSLAVKARAIAQGRPSLTKEEVEQLNSESNKE